MIKALIIIRTSTKKQEVDSQNYEIVNYVKSIGYTDDEIVVVGTKAASAIKLDDRYKENMNKVYATINSNPSIECVYAWGLDRIGRNEELMVGFKNFLIQKKKVMLLQQKPV